MSTGETDSGTHLDGLCGVDPARTVIRYEIAADLPPHMTTGTGFLSSDDARRIVIRGEALLSVDGARFAIDFAGRAVVVVARYTGAL